MSTPKETPPPSATPRRSRRLWRRAANDDRSDIPQSARDAEISEQERIIIDALGDLRDMDVREVMTPRVDVTFLTIPVPVLVGAGPQLEAGGEPTS